MEFIKKLEKIKIGKKNIDIITKYYESGCNDVELLRELDEVETEKYNVFNPFYDGLIIENEWLIEAFKRMYGGELVSLIIKRISSEHELSFVTNMSEDERNFNSIFELNDRKFNIERTKIIFENVSKISNEYLIKAYNEFDYLNKNECYYKLFISLVLIEKGVDFLKELEESVLEKIKDEKIYKLLLKFDPKTESANAELIRNFNVFRPNMAIEIFLYAINKSEFMDKICILLLSTYQYEINITPKEISGKGKSKNITFDYEMIKEFAMKYRPNLLQIIKFAPEYYELIIKENILNQQDFINALNNYNIININKNFILSKTDKIEKFKEADWYSEVENKHSSIEIVKICNKVKNNINNSEFDEFYHRLYLMCLNYQYELTKEHFIVFPQLYKYELSVKFSDILFEKLDSQYDNTIHQFVKKYDVEENKIIVESVAKFLSKNDEFISDLLENYYDLEVVQKFLVIRILGLRLDKFTNEFLGITEKSKQVKVAIDYTYKTNPQLAEYVLPKLTSKKLPERKSAFGVLSNCYGSKYLNEIKTAFELESNDKFKQEIEEFIEIAPTLNIEPVLPKSLDKIADKTDTNDKQVTQDTNIDIDKIVNVLLKSEKTISDIPVTNFTRIKNKSGEYVDEKYVKASLIAFAKDKVLGVCQVADNIVKDFDKDTHELFAKDLFNFYIGGEASTKLKWILYYTSIYGGDGLVDLFTKVIPYFSEQSRHALAVESVKALVLNSSPRALIIVEEMSRKAKQKSIKNASKDALIFMAEQLNITSHELSDRIIPTFGFDTKNELEFDYGTRKFTVTLNSKIELQITDEKGKILKNMPKIGANDVEDIATKSSDEFKAMRKQIKATVKTQAERLDLAIASGRTWTYDNFTTLFVKNPIMNKFATSLIWGTYIDGKLSNTFRYNDDGSYSTQEDEEFILKEDMIIGLIHPIELEQDVLENWTEQLEDYEITQPIEQLKRQISYPEDISQNSSQIDFNDETTYSGSSLKSKLQKIGYELGAVGDGGYISYLYYTDTISNITATLEFSGFSVAYYDELEDDCTLYKLEFKNNNNEPLQINNVSKKIISEFYSALSKVVIRS